jgi:predicted RNA-binding Zn-ribbon protein involved in translation (DUF1610 family)
MLVTVSTILFPAAVVAGLPFLDHLFQWYAARSDRLRESRTRSGRCHSCGYDLTGNVSGRCPECGTPIAPAAMSRIGPSRLR